MNYESRFAIKEKVQYKNNEYAVIGVIFTESKVLYDLFDGEIYQHDVDSIEINPAEETPA